MTTFSLFLSLFFGENHKGYLSTCRLFHSVQHGKSRRHTTSVEGKYRLVGTTAIETAPVWNQNKAYILPVCLAHLILKVIWKYSVESTIFPHPNHISWMADTSTICMYSIMVRTYVVIAKVLMLVLLLKRLNQMLRCWWLPCVSILVWCRKSSMLQCWMCCIDIIACIELPLRCRHTVSILVIQKSTAQHALVYIHLSQSHPMDHVVSGLVIHPHKSSYVVVGR